MPGRATVCSRTSNDPTSPDRMQQRGWRFPDLNDLQLSKCLPLLLLLFTTKDMEIGV